MMRHDMVPAGMKNERFSVGPRIFLNPAQENIVIAAVKAPNLPANEPSNDSPQ